MATFAASGHHTASSGHGGGSAVLVILLIIGIVLLLVGVGIYALNGALGSLQEEKHVNMNLMLSGNDIVVSIHPDFDAPELTAITLHIDGVPIPHGEDRRSLPVSDDTVYVTYLDLAKGVTGQRFVLLTGSFTDGSEALIYTRKIAFT